MDLGPGILDLDLESWIWTWIWTWILTLRLVPRSTSRILYLIYTGFKGFILASVSQNSLGPRIG